MDEATDIRLIQKFLDKELTEEELRLFKDKFLNDPEFSKEVKEYTNMIIALKSADKMEKEQNHASSSEPKIVSMSKKSTTTKFTRRSWYAIAASIILLAGLGFFINYLVNRTVSPQDLYASYFKPYPDVISGSDLVRGTDEILLKAGMSRYKSEEYDEALIAFERLIERDSANNNIRFYAAICYLETEETKEAILFFNSVINDTENEFSSLAKWYKALAHLKSNEITDTRTILNEIIKSNNKKSKEASELLRKLEKL